MQRQILVAVEEVRGLSAFKRRIQCVPFGNRSARVAALSCLSRAMRSKSMTYFWPILCLANESRYFSCAYHLAGIVGWLPCFCCLAFLNLLRPVEHHLSFRDTMFWSSSRVLLDDKARDWSKVAIGLLECCRTPLVRQISPATALNDPDFWKGIVIRTFKFCRILAKFEDLCVVHVHNQLCDVILSPCILQFHRWDRYTWYSVVSSVASGFPVALRILLRFQDDLASCTGGSCEPLCELALRTTRGLRITVSLR